MISPLAGEVFLLLYAGEVSLFLFGKVLSLTQARWGSGIPILERFIIRICPIYFRMHTTLWFYQVKIVEIIYRRIVGLRLVLFRKDKMVVGGPYQLYFCTYHIYPLSYIFIPLKVFFYIIWFRFEPYLTLLSLLHFTIHSFLHYTLSYYYLNDAFSFLFFSKNLTFIVPEKYLGVIFAPIITHCFLYSFKIFDTMQFSLLLIYILYHLHETYSFKHDDSPVIHY